MSEPAKLESRPSHEIPTERTPLSEKVSLIVRSLLNIHSYLYWATIATIPSWVFTLRAQSLVPATSIVIILAGFFFAFNKELKYEISLIYTIFNSKAWWNQITPHLVLGALPLKHQKEKIQGLGITHVVSLLEDFEMKKGLVRPVSSKKWQSANIQHKQIVAVDFVGMPADDIHEAVEYIHQELQEKPDAKFYIHCKAGRGRSATVVTAYLWKYGSQHFATKEEAYAFVKHHRPQINLNENQMAALQAYIEKYPRQII